MACPVGTTSAASGSSIAACTDLVAGYALPLGLRSLVTQIVNCSVARTYCPGKAQILSLSSPIAMVRACTIIHRALC